MENSLGLLPRGARGPITPQQRVVLLDIWERSGASAEEFGELVGLTSTTLYQWRKRFLKDGPLGLMDRPRGVPKGTTRLPQATQRAIVLMKSQHPEWGCDRIHDMLMRCEGYGASPGGLASAFVALRHPELFGNVLSQSGAFWRGTEGSNGAPFEWVSAQYAASPKLAIRFFLDVGATETRGAMGGTAPSILEANRRLRDALRAKGYEVSYTEVPGGTHSPESWRERLPTGLRRIAEGTRP